MIRKLTLALALSSVFSAHATTLLYKDLDALTTESEAIVIGTVGKTESLYGADKTIFTFVTLQSLQEIKGKVKGYDLTLRFEGGQVENDVLRIEGSPRFQSGERVLLFVRGNGRSKVPLVGWTQGVFRVSSENSGGSPIVTDYEGNKLIGVSGKQVLKEQRFKPEALILDQNQSTHRSAPTTAEPGRSDDGKVSNPSTPALAGAGQPLNLNQFLGVIKSRASFAPKSAASSVAAVESAGLPKSVARSRAAPPPAVQGQATPTLGQPSSQGKADAPTLPLRIPMPRNPSMQ